MKNIFSFILVASALTLSTTSCSDFLDEENKVGETADLTYSTSTGISGLINSCYAFSRGWWGKEAGLGLTEMGTDEFFYGYDNKQKSLNSYNFTSASLDSNDKDNPCLDQYWELFYCAVDVCNNALVYVPKCTAINDDVKNKYLGEAYFLRALYYSQMVAMWGPIPYNSEPISAINTNPVRVPEAEVYGNILSDLDESLKCFKEANAMKKSDATAVGHAYYYSAMALKARVLLYAASWLGDKSIQSNENYSGKSLYSLAKDAASEVISNSDASMYDKYAQTFSMDNEEANANKETLFAVHYDSDLKTPVNCIPYRYKLSSSGSKESYVGLITRTGYSRGGSSMNLMFVSMWNNGATDLGGDKKQVFIRVTGESSSYMTNTATNEKINVAQMYSPYGRGFTRYLPSLYLWKLLADNRETDQRFEGTLLSHYNMAPGLKGSAKNYPLMGEYTVDMQTAYDADGNYFNAGDTAIYFCPLDGDSEEGQKVQAWAKNRYRVQFMAGGDIPIYTSMDPATALPTETAVATSKVYDDGRYNNYKIGGWCSFPGIKKFLDDVYDVNYPTNDITSRDAVVLRLAEMYLIKSEAQLALGDESGSKATLNELRAKRAISGKDNSFNGTVTINTLLDERALELCGEQQRWFDLKRTHTLLDRVKKYNKQASANIQEKHYYRPIPEAQMEGVTNRIDNTVSQSNGVLQYSTTADGFWQNPGY